MMLVWDDSREVVRSRVERGAYTPIWNCSSSGIYPSQSCYAVINFRGAASIYISAVWNVKVPPKIHLFLWLLSHNKLATIANLNRKGLAKPEF
jgi:hypothetical protein